MNLFLKVMVLLSCSTLLKSQVLSENVYSGIDYIIKKYNNYDIIAYGEVHEKIEETGFLGFLDNTVSVWHHSTCRDSFEHRDGGRRTIER